MEDYVFAPVLTGEARQLLERRPGVFKTTYTRAGMPKANSSQPANELGFGQLLFDLDERIQSGFIRGEAVGWLSRENDLYCGTDMHNGRFFIIKEFRPSFPVDLR
jgi:hypothetical protein